MKSRIKELRLSRHLTQRELGDIISVTQQNISKYVYILTRKNRLHERSEPL